MTIQEAIEKLDNERNKDLEKIRNTYYAQQRLEDAGLTIKLATHSVYAICQPVVTIDDVKDFAKVHRVVGALQQESIHPVNAYDCRKREVYVYLRSKAQAWSHISFRYIKKLPRDAKCKIVKQKSSYASVVCSV